MMRARLAAARRRIGVAIHGDGTPAQRMLAAARDQLLERNGQALMVVSLALGVTITLSSRARWAAPVWHDALRVPDAPATWGLVILTAGLLLAVGEWLSKHDREHRRVLRIGYLIAWLWSSCLGAVQLSALIHDDSGTANSVGLIIWCYMAFLYNLRYSGSAPDNYA